MPSLPELLALRPIGDDLFEGDAGLNRVAHIFGGALVAQSLVAAHATVEERPCHSIHTHFVHPGDRNTPVRYRVTRTRDGASFSLRQVAAEQGGRTLAFSVISFQRPAPGPTFQVPAPIDAPPPDTLDDSDRRGEPAGLLLRNVGGLIPSEGSKRTDRHLMWCRSDGALGAEPRDHQVAFAYASDFPLLPAILRPHAKWRTDPGLVVTSLDHCLWFHQPIDFDQWLLCDLATTISGDQRGFARGSVLTQEGRIVASLAQEAMIRPVHQPIR